MRAENFTDDTRAWLVFSKAMASHTARPQIDADFNAWRHEQRFEVRRKAEARRRGATLEERSGRTSPTGSDAMPWLLVTVLVSSVGLLALAVFGAYELMRMVFNR